MAETLQHRGPDDEGTWQSEDGVISFGHRRLAVIDVGEGGHQPMILSGGRYALTYNGELYNYLELRDDLIAEGLTFETASDTEVVLKACVTWGVEVSLRKFNGMFAFGFWDAAESRLWLARDRFGEKPLYWSLRRGCLAFASELRALTCVPGFDMTIDRRTLSSFMKFGVCPAPGSIYLGASKLAPGTALSFVVDGSRNAPVAAPGSHVYFDVVEAARAAKNKRFEGSFAEATVAVESAITESIRARMISDVPLGAFLSGGIDSSLVVALMASIHSQLIRTFTIGFEDRDMNEVPLARRVAGILGTQHVELMLTASDMLQVVPRLATIYDEPFADSSQIPTYLVSELARRDVTVSLSGDGGDELFGGYNRYFIGARRWERISRVPAGVRGVGARVIDAIPPTAWNRIGSISGRRRGADGATGNFSERMSKVSRAIGSTSGSDLYDRLVTQWDISPVLLTEPTGQRAWPTGAGADDFTLAELMMLSDTSGYLPDDILTKVDRASMAVSLESRVPMLDPNVFDLAWSLPMDYKIEAGVGKAVLRSVLGRHLPDGAIKGPKKGFGVPLAKWLRNDLREWAEDLLSPESLSEHDYLDVGSIRSAWEEHRMGTADRQNELWPVLMFQSWLSEQSAAVECRPPPAR